jgi:hypothetical protein
MALTNNWVVSYRPRWPRIIQKSFPFAYEQYEIPNDAYLYEFCRTAEPSTDASFYHTAQSDLFTVTAENNTSLIKGKLTIINAYIFIKQIKLHELRILRSRICVKFIATYEASSRLQFSVANSEINTHVLFGIGSPDTNIASAMFRVPTYIYENTRRHIPQQSSSTPDSYGCKNLKPHTITRCLLPTGDRAQL